jgi:hypothetical protein
MLLGFSCLTASLIVLSGRAGGKTDPALHSVIPPSAVPSHR